MTHTPESAQADLAFMRGLIEGGGPAGIVTMGQVFFAGGLLYGLQATSQWAEAAGLVDWPAPVSLLSVVLPTLLFIGVLIWVSWRRRGLRTGGASQRAVAAIFQSVGLANMMLALVFATVAIRRHDMVIWMLEPITIFVVMGAAFAMTGGLRRRWWLVGVGAGWWLCAIAAGFFIATSTYVLVIALGLFAFMGAPGLYMMRRPEQV